jgi:hypothetical protein
MAMSPRWRLVDGGVRTNWSAPPGTLNSLRPDIYLDSARSVECTGTATTSFTYTASIPASFGAGGNS